MLGRRSDALIVLAALSACSSTEEVVQPRPSQPMAVRLFSASGFTRVHLTAPDNAIIRVGPAFSIRAEGPRDILTRMVVAPEGDIPGRRAAAEAEFADLSRLDDTLVITRDLVSVEEWKSRRPPRVTVYITMPQIESVDMASSGRMVVSGLKGSRFAAGAGRGHLILPSMNVEQAVFAIGDGTVTASGRADRLDLEIHGSADVDLRGLSVSSAAVDSSGSGTLRAAINGPASVSLTGSGDIDLGPRARCQTAKSGSGIVRCGG